MDELTDWERGVEAVNKFANIVHIYYEALREAGFDDATAKQLTIEYQQVILIALIRTLPSGK